MPKIRESGGTTLIGSTPRERAPRELRDALEQLAARRPDLAVDVEWFAIVPSTMDAVAKAAARGAPAGYVAIADQQTAGRGRRGHSWCSPPNAGLYFSYLVRPTARVELLTMAAGVGVLEGVASACSLRGHLKWPNDLLVGPRKLAGLLAEGAHIGTSEAAVTLGVGVNLAPAAYPPDVAARATSVRGELGRSVARFEVFAVILEHLADAIRALERGDASAILRSWRAAAPTAVGTTVRWVDAGQPKEGVTAGIDETGALLVRTPSRLERVIAGELRWDIA